MQTLVFARGIERVVGTVAQIATYTQAQTFDAVVVDAYGSGIGCRHLELVGASRSVMNPTLVAKSVGVQTSQEHGFIAPVTSLTPQAHTRLMPCTGQDGVLALGTIDGKEFGRQVGIVGATYGYNHMAHAQVQRRSEGFLQPELLQGDLAATLNFRLIFAGLFLFNLYGALGTTMLKLNLSAQGPPLTEVVAQIDDYVGQVELAVALVVLVQVGIGVALVVVAVEHAAGHSLAITAYCQAMLCRFNLFGGCGIVISRFFLQQVVSIYIQRAQQQ